jgi:D-3-phosphoglycerate dehydrogenase
MKEILISESEGFSREALAILSKVGSVTAADLDRASLLAAVPHADVLWIRLRHRIDREVFAAASRLRVLASPTTGLDHIDLEEADRRSIQVISLRGAQEFLRDVRATAELTIGLMLSILRNIPAAAKDVTDGNWRRDRFKGYELRGAKVGIVGFGRLGRLVAGYLDTFGARVLACDTKPFAAPPSVEVCTFGELIARADIVSVHVELNPTSFGLFDRDAFSRMKQGAVFVNTARGDVVQSDALIDALARGHLRAAAVDVVSGEAATGVSALPLVQYAKDHPELLVTPHIGGCTYESMAMTEVFLAERVRAALRAEP